MAVEYSQAEAARPLSLAPRGFWAKLLDLLFVHVRNNFFLRCFRRLLHFAMLLRRRILGALMREHHGQLFLRCYAFLAQSEASPAEYTEAHGYLVEMLCTPRSRPV